MPKTGKDGKITGRRPRPANEFTSFKDIVSALKDKDQKWVDTDSPDRKDGYRDEDMIKKPFIYRSANEVWPTLKAQVVAFSYRCRNLVPHVTQVSRTSNLHAPVVKSFLLILAMSIR